MINIIIHQMKYLIFFIVLIFIAIGCGKTLKESSTHKESKPLVKSTKPEYTEATMFYEDFDKFYQKFHNDSLFQMSRVKFPLKGYEMDTTEQTKSWSKQNWTMHRAKISEVDTAVFKTDIEMNSNFRKERIFIDGGGFNSERVFKRINGKWYLTLFVNEDM